MVNLPMTRIVLVHIDFEIEMAKWGEIWCTFAKWGTINIPTPRRPVRWSIGGHSAGCMGGRVLSAWWATLA
jgi:hypothetical protein